MREHGVPAFTVDAHRPLGAFDVLGRQLRHRARLHEPAHGAGPGRDPAARRRPRRATTRSSSPVGTRRSTRSRSPTSSTSRRSATARRSSATSPTSCAAWKADGRPGGRRELLLRLGGGRRAATCRRSTPSPTAPDGAIAAVAPADPRVPRTVHEAHHHRPRRLALPEDAARADGRDRARAGERRDLPRLHPRLPVLPGRDDHPAGARAVAARDRRDGRRRGARVAGSTRSGCCRCPARTTRRSPRSPRAWPTATRAPTRRSRCPAPGSTRSTSTSPTRSAATAAAPG